MKIYLSWSDFKNTVTNKSAVKFIEKDEFYNIYFGEFETSIMKDSGANQTDFESNYKASANKAAHIITGVQESVPFAKPDYRTKRSKTSVLATIAPNTTETIDYQITEERYVSGGSIVYDNAEMGDYVTASVYDKDAVIPLAYRAALCEAWPVVAEYIPGEWLLKGSHRHEINTYPLNAKITVGLYLRITYYAANSGSNRVVGVNYYLTKKL